LIRQTELSDLLTEILSPGFLQAKLAFPEGVSIDESKIIMAGHSFGGGVALGFSSLDERVTGCIALDPWMLAYSGEKDHP